MRIKFQQLIVFLLTTVFISVISASESPGLKQGEPGSIITTNAMILEEFSGLETTPIVKAFMSWVGETRGDILILPPTEQDVAFFRAAMGDGIEQIDYDLGVDKTLNPWSKQCRHTFYVVRVSSNSQLVKEIDGKNRSVMAFTFTGCMYKFIAIVADRMTDEKVMYEVVLHELGHLWGLPDNKLSQGLSVMRGYYPTSTCITKLDIKNLYDVHGKKGLEKFAGGCDPVKVDD